MVHLVVQQFDTGWHCCTDTKFSTSGPWKVVSGLNSLLPTRGWGPSAPKFFIRAISAPAVAARATKFGMVMYHDYPWTQIIETSISMQKLNLNLESQNLICWLIQTINTVFSSISKQFHPTHPHIQVDNAAQKNYSHLNIYNPTVCLSLATFSRPPDLHHYRRQGFLLGICRLLRAFIV